MRTLKFGIWIVGSLVTALAQEKELEAKDVTEKVRQRYN